MKKTKVDGIDKHILYLLDTNARIPISKISKKVKLSKPAVESRIKRLVNEKVIKEFQLVTDPAFLGYEHFKVYVQLQNADVKTERKILNYLRGHPRIFWVVSSRGRWDIIFSFHAKGVREFGELLRKFMDKFSQYILGRTINILECAPIFNRSYLWPEQKRMKWDYGGRLKPIKIDETNKKILGILRKDSREKLVNIAKKIGISPEAVRIRIKNMEKDGIIQGYRIGLNLEKIGYESYLVAFKFKNLDSKIWKNIVSFADNGHNVIYLPKTIGSHDLDIEIEVKDSKEFNSFVNSFRRRFGDVLQGFESAQIVKEEKIEYYHQ